MKVYIHLILLFILVYNPVHAQLDVINTGTIRYISQLKLVDNMVLINGNNFLGKCYGGCDTVFHLSMPDDYPYWTGMLHVIDSSTYYVMTGEPFPHHYLVYKTVDGGNNWESIFDTTGILIHHFAMMDTSVGMLFATSRRMLRTTDGWKTWTENNNSLIVTTAVEVFDDSTLCTGTLSGFRISKDKGSTWKHSTFAQNTPRRFFFLNKDTLFAISYSTNHGALFSYSLDEGNSWVHSGLSIYPYGIYFKNIDEGYIVGRSWPDNLGVIIKTNDLGQTWQVFHTGYNSVLTDMKFINDSIALISGSGGLLLRWNTNDTLFTVSTGEYQAPKNGISLFPNPANNLQKIQITTGKQETLTVELFDLQGRLIKNIYHGKPSAGENIFSVDFSPLARGVYFYRIMIGDKYYFQKTIKNQDP